MKINHFIDHTLLKAQATSNDVNQLCLEAQKYSFAAVCVNSSFLPQVVKTLRGSSVKACVVNSFPLGANCSKMKLQELDFALNLGAQEVDTVINITKVLENEWQYIEDELAPMVDSCNIGQAKLKVILETCYLTDEQIASASAVCLRAKVHFIKTSTGFGTSGARVSDIKIMKSIVGNECAIKASGGIKTYGDAIKMINAGANRIGTSSGINIVG